MNIHHPYNGNTNFPNQSYSQNAPFNNAFPNSLDNNNNISNNQQLLFQQRISEASQQQQHSPGLANHGFNVASVVPAKRSRPGEEDNMTASPRTMSGQFGSSRSHTPQQPGFQSQFPQMNQPGNPYQHLHGSPNGMSPSIGGQGPWQPPVKTQPGQSPQTMNQAAPNNFNAMRGGMPSSALGQSRSTPDQSRPGAPNMQPDAVRDAQQRYKLQLEMQQRQLNSNNANFANRMNMPAMSGNNNAGAFNGMPQNRSMIQQQAQAQAQAQVQKARSNEQSFMNSLTEYTSRNGVVLEPDPKVCGRSISYFQLFAVVTQMKTLSPGPNFSNWTAVATQLGIPVHQFPEAPEEVKGIFSRNLASFVTVWTQILQKRKLKAQQQVQAQQAAQLGASSAGQFPTMSPTSNSQPFQRVQQGSGQMFSPDLKSQTSSNQQEQSGLRQMSPSQNNGPFPSGLPPDPAAALRELSQPRAPSNSAATPTDSRAVSRGPQVEQQPAPIIEAKKEVKPTVGTGFEPQVQRDEENYRPRRRLLVTEENPYYGGLPVDAMGELGEKLAKVKPGVPSWEEMGVVDIHTLTMSIQSGIHGEIRYALDDLVGLSHDARINFQLAECEALLEALVNCAESQVEYLVEHYDNTLDDINFPNFEKLIRATQKENRGLLDDPPFASLAYERQSAVDRLLAVTTILRNWSIPDSLQNHDMLTMDWFVSFVASTVRAIGLRPELLVTNRNLVDFMKDVVTLLSNTAHRLEISSCDDAYALLHFLIAFRPMDAPSRASSGKLLFQSYDPRRHQYLPCAIDAFAKLFARDEPNRSFFRTILYSDIAKDSDLPLITRAFALAVAPIPNRQLPTLVSERADLIRTAQDRNPFLTQAMLAGDILASLLQTSDDSIASAWLNSEDAWAPSLLQLAISLGYERNMRHHGGAAMIDFEAGGCNLVVQRGLSMLKKLVERVDKQDGGVESLFGVQPERYAVLTALTTQQFEAGALRHLVAFAALEG